MLNIPVLINVPGYAAFNEEANEQQVIEETFIDAIFLHWGISTKMFDDKMKRYYKLSITEPDKYNAKIKRLQPIGSQWFGYEDQDYSDMLNSVTSQSREK